MTPAGTVQKLWNFYNVLHDDGMSYPPSQCFGRVSGDQIES